MYFDTTYILFVLPAVILSLWASWNVKHTYKKYEQQINSRGLTGASAARRVLDAKQQRNAECKRQDEVRENERTATVLGSKRWEPPQVS